MGLQSAFAFQNTITIHLSAAKYYNFAIFNIHVKQEILVFKKAIFIFSQKNFFYLAFFNYFFNLAFFLLIIFFTKKFFFEKQSLFQITVFSVICLKIPFHP